jgi:hypothetical protein
VCLRVVVDKRVFSLYNWLRFLTLVTSYKVTIMTYSTGTPVPVILFRASSRS